MTGDLTLENSAFVCIHVMNGEREPEKTDVKDHYMCTPCWDEKDKDVNSVLKNIQAVHKGCADAAYR